VLNSRASAPLDIYSHIKKGKAGIWRYFSRNTEQESIAPGSFRQYRFDSIASL